jgi:DNA-binding transcriptional ArsR family regulator
LFSIVRKVDALLHPVRLRIVQAFLGREAGDEAGEGTRTARELAAALPDVAQATLYRQLAALVDSGVLEVVDEHRVRGAAERVYALPRASASLLGADLAGATAEDHLRYFVTFLAALQGEYVRYLRRGTPDLEADGVGYRTFTVNLADEEFAGFMAELNDLVLRAAANPDAPGRRRRLFARVVMPLAGETGPAGDEER